MVQPRATETELPRLQKLQIQHTTNLFLVNIIGAVCVSQNPL